MLHANPWNDPILRFWSRVDKRDENECWNWLGPTNGAHGSKRRGFIIISGLRVQVHRFSWEIHYSEIPGSMLVCHHCDNGLCVNPKHLFLGSYKDNSTDASSKGRLVRS